MLVMAMNADVLVEQFEESRPRLGALAYRMLGSRAEADDAVQETWLRVARAGADDVDNLGGWLTTIVGRVCLSRLRQRRRHPEELAGVRPVTVIDESDPETDAITADSIGAALLLVLDVLPPAERVVFVLHDVFDVPFHEIGPIVGRSTEAARQLASRARRRVRRSSPPPGVDLVRQREIVRAFLAAARAGEFDALLNLLDPDVELRPDATAASGGGIRRLRGAREVASDLSTRGSGARLALVDGVAGGAWMPGGTLRGVATMTVVDGRITAIDVIGDPERMRDLDIVLLEDREEER